MINTREYTSLPSLIRALTTKMLLNTYERKGLYWEKEMQLDIKDILNLLKAYHLHRENDIDYLKLLMSALEESLFEKAYISEKHFSVTQRKNVLELFVTIRKITQNLDTDQNLEALEPYLELIVKYLLRDINNLSANARSIICEEASYLPLGLINNRLLLIFVTQIYYKLEEAISQKSEYNDPISL